MLKIEYCFNCGAKQSDFDRECFECGECGVSYSAAERLVAPQIAKDKAQIQRFKDALEEISEICDGGCCGDQAWEASEIAQKALGISTNKDEEDNAAS